MFLKHGMPISVSRHHFTVALLSVRNLVLSSRSHLDRMSNDQASLPQFCELRQVAGLFARHETTTPRKLETGCSAEQNATIDAHVKMISKCSVAYQAKRGPRAERQGLRAEHEHPKHLSPLLPYSWPSTCYTAMEPTTEPIDMCLQGGMPFIRQCFRGSPWHYGSILSACSYPSRSSCCPFTTSSGYDG